MCHELAQRPAFPAPSTRNTFPFRRRKVSVHLYVRFTALATKSDLGEGNKVEINLAKLGEKNANMYGNMDEMPRNLHAKMNIIFFYSLMPPQKLKKKSVWSNEYDHFEEGEKNFLL